MSANHAATLAKSVLLVLGLMLVSILLHVAMLYGDTPLSLQ